MSEAEAGAVPARPRILLLALGGTIAMTAEPGAAVTPRLRSEDLVAAVPGLADAAAVEADTFRTIPGAHLSFADLGELAARIKTACAAEGFDGVVVTQGTDTLEETSFLVDLLAGPDRRVVFTGAMRNPTQPGADGPANVLAATLVAGSPAAAGIGTTVVLGDEVHAARYVHKTHTASPAAFRSSNGPLGWVGEGTVRIALRPPAVPALELSALGEARVALLTAALDDDGALVEAAAEACQGIVVEALGGGHLPLPWVERLERAAARVPVALASRTGTGEVLRATYGFPGSETDLIARGLIPAGWLDGPKARVLMTLLLRAGGDDSVRDGFERYLSAPSTPVGGDQ